MLDDHDAVEETATVLRLASVADDTVAEMLLQRGIEPENVRDFLDLISPADVTVTPADALDNAFRAREDRPSPFPPGRFGDGTHPVYYSALEERTCKEELSFHLRATDQSRHPRFYSLIQCRYQGMTVDLRGRQADYPDLVSDTKRGYPFCQMLARQALKNGTDAFFTASARHHDGTCVPVFTRTSLSDPAVIQNYRATVGADGVAFSELESGVE